MKRISDADIGQPFQAAVIVVFPLDADAEGEVGTNLPFVMDEQVIPVQRLIGRDELVGGEILILELIIAVTIACSYYQVVVIRRLQAVLELEVGDIEILVNGPR